MERWWIWYKDGACRKSSAPIIWLGGSSLVLSVLRPFPSASAMATKLPLCSPWLTCFLFVSQRQTMRSFLRQECGTSTLSWLSACKGSWTEACLARRSWRLSGRLFPLHSFLEYLASILGYRMVRGSSIHSWTLLCFKPFPFLLSTTSEKNPSISPSDPAECAATLWLGHWLIWQYCLRSNVFQKYKNVQGNMATAFRRMNNTGRWGRKEGN